MASIFRRKPGGNFHVEFTNERGKRGRVSAKTKDRRLAQQIGARLEREAAERRAGVLPAAASREPLGELLAEYLGDLRRLGRTGRYVRDTERVLTKIFAAARWGRAEDMKPGGLTRFLAAAKSVAARTSNQYRDYAVWFAGWLVQTGRLAANPLTTVRRGRVVPTRPRRALTADELGRLLKAAPPDRSFAYALMALSGLRRKEAKLLTWQDIDATAAEWRWTLRAEITKSRRAEVLPMLPECRELLLARFPRKADPHTPVLPRVPYCDTFAKDLASAGVPKVGANGRRAELHSLRYTFCTRLAEHLPIQTVQRLMRHKNVNMTVQVYLDLGLSDVAEAVRTLPRILNPEDE